jgi:para-aminobenzoate synthetase component I
VSDRVFVHPLPPHLAVTDTLARFADERLCVLLDSATPNRERDGRYTYLTADPVAITRLDTVAYGDKPFAVFREWQQRLPNVDNCDAPPFCGGIAGLAAYELGEAFERLPRPEIDEFETPVLLAGLFDWCIVWDHITRSVQCWILTLEDHLTSDSACRQSDADDRLTWVLQKLSQPLPCSKIAASRPNLAIDPRARAVTVETVPAVSSDFSKRDYVAAVDRVIEYIRAGDIFQANVSQRLIAPWSGSAVELYERVRHRNAAPFCAFLQTDDFAVVSASPERFLKVDQAGCVETRPIKGTRRRQRSPIADLFTSDALADSHKDRSENVMIVDLLRNDISKVCRPGSVRVTGLCEIERFETVQHLVSTVVGQLRSGCDVWDLLAGCFPGGSITGVPKIRAMEIIAELEPTIRGAYCGSLFFCGPGEQFDSNILIRTFTFKDGWVQFPVGGGIVADSNAREEFDETMHKASGMLRALARRKH